MQDVNSVTIVARLAAEPELRTTGGGTKVANLRVAFNKSSKNQSTGEWEDQGCFVDVTVFGGQAEACCKVLTKGRQIVVKGRLDQRSYETESGRRSWVGVVAEQVQFLSDGRQQSSTQSSPVTQQSNPANAPVADDDVPF